MNFNVLYLFCGLVGLLLTQCAPPKYKLVGVARSINSYKIEGQWYTPQRHYNYDQIGLASWYGPGFHGKAKAQGEPYNQYAMTAAHRTLPLPTIVRVTNLSNGKSIVVLVDDRGPFKYKGRIIDLSVSAARELGLHKQGLGKVRVQVLQKESADFSLFLVEHCGKFGDKTGGLTWEELYKKNIGNKPGYRNLTTPSAYVRRLNNIDEAKRKTEAAGNTLTVAHAINKIAGLNIVKGNVARGNNKIIIGKNPIGINREAAKAKAKSSETKETSLTSYIKKNFRATPVSKAATHKPQQKARAKRP